MAAVAIAALAMSEILRRIASMQTGAQPIVRFDPNQPAADQRVSRAEYWGCRFALLRGALIGTAVGAVPGMGSWAAAFFSYAATKQSAKDPETFGNRNIKGLAATGSANSAVAGATSFRC